MNNTAVEAHQSSIGNMQANVMAMLCYVSGTVLGFIPVISYVAWLAPLVIFFIEKESHFVKFHAMQAFLLNLVGVALGLLVSVVLGGIMAASVAMATDYASMTGALGSIAIVGVLTTIISLLILVIAIIALIKAYKYSEYQIPLIGGLAKKLAGKVQ
ncbi:MAG: DUF4870 domain-containing protein [Christensenellales bacterium]